MLFMYTYNLQGKAKMLVSSQILNLVPWKSSKYWNCAVPGFQLSSSMVRVRGFRAGKQGLSLPIQAGVLMHHKCYTTTAS